MRITTEAFLPRWLELLRAEYTGIPGLQLTKQQVERMWGLDAATSDAVLGELVEEHFLRKTAGGTYVRADADWSVVRSAKHAGAAKSSYLRRLMGAAVLDRATYEEVEADENATMQAFGTVLLSSLAAGLGSRGLGGSTVADIAVVGAIALMSWAIWAVITFEIGVRLMPQPQTRSNVGELLRTIGFATAPGCLSALGILPGSTVPVFALSAIWMLAATVVAVRQALDYESTPRALAVCALGWVLAIVMAIVLGVVFGPSVS